MATRAFRYGQKAVTAQTPRLARSLATPTRLADFQISEAAGIKVATADEGQPTSAISVVVKAGSRFEPSPGVAHALKNFTFKNTSKRSALRIVRETELFGGVLTSSLTREHLFLTAEFVRGDEGYFAEILGDALTKAKFAPYEYKEEVVPQVAAEYEQAISSPTVFALDLAHGLAFRKGLGNSLFATPHTEISYNEAVSFAKTAFNRPDNVAVLGTGVDNGVLRDLVGEFFVPESTAPTSLQSPSSKYYGGEVRVPLTEHDASDVGNLLIGFEGGALDNAAFTVLRFLLGGEASVKWTVGTTPLAKLTEVSKPLGVPSAKAFNLAYSDAGLFGFHIVAPTRDVHALASKTIEEFKKVAGGASEEDVKKAIAQAKFAAASALEGRIGRLEIVGSSLASNGNFTSLDSAYEALDKVTVSQVSKAAESALKSRATVVAVGDTHKLPYADELGLKA